MEAAKTGKLIHDIRTEKGMTQQALADALHVSATAVSKWENGHSLPDISLLEPLSSVLDVSISDIVIGERSRQEMREEHSEAAAPEKEAAIREVISESVKQRRKKVVKWVLATLAVCAAIAGCVIMLFFVGFKPKRDQILVSKEIQTQPDGRSEWVIHFETVGGKTLYSYTEPVVLEPENGDQMPNGTIIHLRVAPLGHVDPGSFTWGYSLEPGLVPADDFDFYVIVDYADGEEKYSMREEGLFQ